eukprot:gene5725-4086_t
MQRDAYAALVKKKHKRKIPLRILQMSGEIFNELIFDEVFIGYRNRRLVLTTHMAGTDPRQGKRLPQDVLVQDFAKLQRLHQPHFVYKLVPMMCSNVETFSVLQGVCSSRGSPFAIEDRYDTHGLTTRFGIVSTHRSLVMSELLQCPLLSAAQMANVRLGNFPIPGVEFDGALVKRGKIGGGVANTGNPGHVAPTAGLAVPSPIPETPAPSGEALVPGDAPRLSPGLAGKPEGTSKPPVPSGVNFVSAAALVTRVDYLTEGELTKRMIMNHYFHSATYWKLGSNGTLFQLVRDTRDKIHVLGVSNPIIQGRSDLLTRAKQHRIHVYEKVAEDVYQYALP